MKRIPLQFCFWNSKNETSCSVGDGINPVFDKYGKCKKVLHSMKSLVVLFFSMFTMYSAIAQPTVAAPTPFCDQANVISLFSEAYADVPVDTWLTFWSSATLTDTQIAGNDVKLYENVDFLGIETVGPNLVDASAMTNFHIDIWTPNMTTFRVKLVDFGADMAFGGGDDTEHEVVFTSPAQNEWVSYDIPLSDFTGLASTANIAQYILSGIPIGGGTVYVDNVYFSDSGCVTQAPDPTIAQADVISMFSNVYNDVPVDTWLTFWSSATLTDIQISNNDTKLYENVDFLGIETVGPNLIDASAMTNFHIDIWTPNMTIFRVKLVDFGADENFGGGDDTEHEIEFVSPAQNEWISYTIPMSSFTGLASTTDIAQLILSGQPIGGGTVYVDNVYYSSAVPPAADVTLCVDLSCLPSATAPSVFGGFNGWCANCNFLSDPDGDDIWCATVNMPNGAQEYKFFVQEGEESFMPGAPCTVTNGGNTNRVINVAGVPLSETYGFNSCDATCMPPPPGPDLPLTFDDPAINYNIGDFGGMSSAIGPDPTNPANMVVCSTKPNGAPVWAGTVAGNSGLDNPVPFSPTNLVMQMDVFSPNVGTPFLLKVEDAGNAAISSEVLATTTVANAWETLYFDFANGAPAVNFANTYAKVVVFSNFGNIGANQTYCWDNIMMCDGSFVPVITCPATQIIEGCDVGDIATGPFCDQPQATAGFPSDPGCEAAICAADGFCCSVSWDGICAGAAAVEPACTGCLTTAGTPPFSTVLTTITADEFLALGGTIVDDCGDLTVTYIDTQAGTCPIVVNRVYTVTDDLGNLDACNQTIIIDDTQAPVITCPPTANIEGCDTDAIAAEGLPPFSATSTASTEAAFIAQGGTVTEGCNVASVTYVDVAVGTCPITVTRTYTFTDDCGNISSCDQTITIGDNTAPAVNGAMNMTVECDGTGNAADLAAWLASNGGASATDDCGVVWTNDFVALSEDCGATGSATVTFTATDPCGNALSTTATFTISDTQAPVITCPPNQFGLTCNQNPPAAATNFDEFIALGGTISEGCSTPAELVVVDMLNDNGGDNCPGNGLVITRTYTIIDACGNASSCDQTFTYIESTTGPVITSIAPTCYKYCADLANPMESDITYDTDCNFGATVSITGPTQIGPSNCQNTIYRYTYTVTDDCGRVSAPVSRDFVIGNEGPTIECAPFNLILECGDPNNDDYIATHLSQVSANASCDLGVTISNNFTGLNFTSCTNSTKVVTFTATDDCGRTATCTTTITLQDNTAPELISTYEDGICNEAICGSNVNFWFNEWMDKVEEGLSATDQCDNFVTFTTIPSNPQPNQDCPDNEAETVVTWVANDNCGNTTTISYSFYVVPAATPAPTADVSGMVHTEMMEAVEDVEVTLSGGASFFEMMTTTNDGMYSFADVPLEQNYQVTPYLNQNPLNGVSSFDLILIAQHILGVNSLDSPYKMIAADINKSGSITTLDLLELRKLILYIDTEFTNNTSWRFVETDFVFPNPTNPFASSFPEVVDINGLLEDVAHDFVGVKIGDVNNSALPNLLGGIDDRNFVGDLAFNVNDQKLTAGETYEVTFQADNFEALLGYQFSLNFDQNALDFVSLGTGDLSGLSESNFGLSLLDKGVITTSWSNEASQTVDADAAVFQISFVAKADVLLSEVLSVSSQFTKAEAYNERLELMDVQLRFNDNELVVNAFRLMQNSPNPFGQETLIGFHLPEAGFATMNIFDGSGRLLKRVEGDFEKGFNSISVSSEELTVGLLYYQLVTNTDTATKKMVLTNK